MSRNNRNCLCTTIAFKDEQTSMPEPSENQMDTSSKINTKNNNAPSRKETLENETLSSIFC